MLIVVAGCSAPFDGQAIGATTTDAGTDSDAATDAAPDADAADEPEARPAGDIGDPCSQVSDCTALLAGDRAQATVCLPLFDAGFTCLVWCSTDNWCAAHGGTCVWVPGTGGEACTR